jgi:hypothetical protein
MFNPPEPIAQAYGLIIFVLTNPVILLGFLLNKIKLTGQLSILDEVLNGIYNEEY